MGKTCEKRLSEDKLLKLNKNKLQISDFSLNEMKIKDHQSKFNNKLNDSLLVPHKPSR